MKILNKNKNIIRWRERLRILFYSRSLRHIHLLTSVTFVLIRRTFEPVAHCRLVLKIWNSNTVYLLWPCTPSIKVSMSWLHFCFPSPFFIFAVSSKSCKKERKQNCLESFTRELTARDERCKEKSSCLKAINSAYASAYTHKHTKIHEHTDTHARAHKYTNNTHIHTHTHTQQGQKLFPQRHQLCKCIWVHKDARTHSERERERQTHIHARVWLFWGFEITFQL